MAAMVRPHPRTLDVDILGSAIRLRRDLHGGPETANLERATAKQVIEYLGVQGVRPWRTGVGGHGLLYKMPGSLRGKATLLRAELDALPIHEERNLAHRSRVEGRHHACGHDGHMAMLAAALAQLARNEERRADVFALFQPAEETGEGAARVLQAVSKELPPFDRAYAIHNYPGLPLGMVGVRNGTSAKPSMGLEIEMRGVRTHASEPEQGRSPLPALAALVRSVQASAAPPRGRRTAFATLIGLNTGDNNFGVSPADARLALTLRADDQPRLDRLLEHVERRARTLAKAHRLRLKTKAIDVFRETRNHPGAVADVRAAARRAGLRVSMLRKPLSASEDFGRFTERWPGALILLGAGRDHPPLHHATYDFPDELLRAGAELWLALANPASTLSPARKPKAATV